jgi:site-specific recombinase XerD
MGKTEVEAFLTWLANVRRVSASTHRQALSAILFLYKEVLDTELPWLDEIGRPKAREHLPTVLSRTEIEQILSVMDGEMALLAKLLYGTGMRLREGLGLRIKDLDFDHRAIIVRQGKGNKDRVVMLPDSLETPLRQQLARARVLWSADRAAGVLGVSLSHVVRRSPIQNQAPSPPLSGALAARDQKGRS